MIQNDGPFARLIRDFGGGAEEEREVKEEAEETAIEEAPLGASSSKSDLSDEKKGRGDAEGTGKEEVSTLVYDPVPSLIP